MKVSRVIYVETFPNVHLIQLVRNWFHLRLNIHKTSESDLLSQFFRCESDEIDRKRKIFHLYIY